MPVITYFAVLPFSRTEEGDFLGRGGYRGAQRRAGEGDGCPHGM
jgi:hypothetical protein